MRLMCLMLIGCILSGYLPQQMMPGGLGGNGMGSNVSQICQSAYKYTSDVNQDVPQVMVISNMDQVFLANISTNVQARRQKRTKDSTYCLRNWPANPKSRRAPGHLPLPLSTSRWACECVHLKLTLFTLWFVGTFISVWKNKSNKNNTLMKPKTNI